MTQEENKVEENKSKEEDSKSNKEIKKIDISEEEMPDFLAGEDVDII
mgnify:CR=1 FL=1